VEKESEQNRFVNLWEKFLEGVKKCFWKIYFKFCDFLHKFRDKKYFKRLLKANQITVKKINLQ
jgi:hypothetical protein